MTTDLYAWAVFFVVDCFALYAAFGALVFSPVAGRYVPSLAREWVSLLTVGALAGQAVATCYLLAINGWI